MKTYEELCDEVEAIDPFKYPLYISSHSQRVMSALEEILQVDKDKTMDYLLGFYVAYSYADGKVSEEELIAMEPLLYTMLGSKADMFSIRNRIRDNKKNAENIMAQADFIIDKIGELNEELKEDFVRMSLMVCSVDGKITKKEKNYIRQLIK